MLLTRDKFREKVFARDKNKCVFCKNPAVDAHHILDRKLFPDGGYYLDNGASVCEDCHIKCESCELSVEEVRGACKIKNIIVPPGFSLIQSYDKWGKMSKYQKYPRSMHLPWSPGLTSDDKMIETLDRFIGQRVIVTEKMDGENTTMYDDHVHARSIDSKNHPSRDWVKQFHASIKYDIPSDMRICGENTYAVHSIKYDDLKSYFLGFSVWKNDLCLSWDETSEWFELFGITPVNGLFDGIWNERFIQEIGLRCVDAGREGYVVRLASSFTVDEFSTCLAKYVRENHVQTDEHWMTSEVVKNGMNE